MGGIIDIAGSILSRSERAAEISAQNVANLTTPGFKSYLNFDALVKVESDGNAAQPLARNFSPGQLMVTDRALDLAIEGEGFFVLMTDSGPAYTRNGQFALDRDGRLVSSQGAAVLDAGLNEIVLSSEAVEVRPDGLVLDNGAPAGRLAIVTFEDVSTLVSRDAGAFSGPDTAEEAVGASVLQGMLETSNVSTATEMIAVMEALQRAESGRRLVGVYDDLMGRVLSSLGQ